MADTPDWEPLGDALKRVVEATRVSEKEAKTRLCQAMAAHTVAVRFAPIYFSRRGVRGGSFIPNAAVLSPDDLDWMDSRPQNASSIGPLHSLTDSWTGQPFVLELFVPDVIEVLCGGVDTNLGERETRKSTVETEAINALASRLKICGNYLRREEAFEWLKGQGFELSERGFQNRVWPDARVQAGLDPKAPRGRKSKSLR
jgi:hypothetical protein